MGSYTSFAINGYEFFHDKNYYTNFIMTIFTEDMRIDTDIVDDNNKNISIITR